MEIEKEISKLEEEIKSAESDLSKSQGRKESLESRLKEKWNINTLEEAEKLLSSLEEKGKNLVDEINNDYQKLTEQFEW